MAQGGGGGGVSRAGGFAVPSEGKSRNQGELGRVEALTPIMKHPLARTCACQTPAKWPATPSCSQQRLPLRPPAPALAGFSPKTGQIRAKIGRNPANGLMDRGGLQATIPPDFLGQYQRWWPSPAGCQPQHLRFALSLRPPVCVSLGFPRKQARSGPKQGKTQLTG